MQVVDVLEQGIADGTHRRLNQLCRLFDILPGRDRHSARLDAISSAVYVDTGIAEAGDPGRSKPFPSGGL